MTAVAYYGGLRPRGRHAPTRLSSCRRRAGADRRGRGRHRLRRPANRRPGTNSPIPPARRDSPRTGQHLRRPSRATSCSARATATARRRRTGSRLAPRLALDRASAAPYLRLPTRRRDRRGSRLGSPRRAARDWVTASNARLHLRRWAHDDEESQTLGLKPSSSAPSDLSGQSGVRWRP